MKVKNIGIYLLSMILSALFVSNCFAGSHTKNTLNVIKNRGTMKVGMDLFQPWAMYDKNGQLIGFEIDVAKELAKDMGVKVEFVPTKWSGIIPALLSGKFDLIIGGMGVTEERKVKVDFTVPYYYSGMSLVASRDKAKGMTSLEAFNKPGVILAAKLGTTGAKAAKKYFPKATHVFFDDEPQGLQEVLNSRAHAYVASAPFPAHQAYKYSDKLFLPQKETFTKEAIAFALRKKDDAFMKYLNTWIEAKQKSGWLATKHDYWFGTLKWESLLK